MKLKDYLEYLNNLVKDDPEILDYDVIYAADDEGNHFSKLHYTPSLGYFDGDNFYSSEAKEDYEIEDADNSICIN